MTARYCIPVLTRDYRLDRAKGALIFLVVVGHVLAAVTVWGETEVTRGVRTAIYAFHMPAFVFLAGVTAKSSRLTQRVLFYLVLLLTAQPLYYGWMTLLGLEPDAQFHAWVPHWLTWFLLSMVWWTLSVPFIERFPRVMVAISTSAALFGGMITTFDYEFSFSRTLVFWAFFCIGKVYGKQILHWTGQLRRPGQMALLLAAVLGVSLLFIQNVDKYWLYGSRNFEWFDASFTEGVGMRALVAVTAILCTVAFLSFISDKNDVIAVAGRHSLAVFLLHGFAVRVLASEWVTAFEALPPVALVLACLLVSAGITFIFALSPFNTAIRVYGEKLSQLMATPLAKASQVIRVRERERAMH